MPSIVITPESKPPIVVSVTQAGNTSLVTQPATSSTIQVQGVNSTQVSVPTREPSSIFAGQSTSLSELKDIALASLMNGDTLAWNQARNSWVNTQPASTGGAPSFEESSPTFTYDSQGNLTQITYASGNTKIINYTTQGDIASVVYSRFSEVITDTFNYDTQGNLLGITRSSA